MNAVGGSSRQAWEETARKTEALGYSALVVADHVWTQLAPLAALVAAAEATTTLRIGGYVFGNDFWHPAILAREVASIDLLSGGRLEFGIGTGWERDDYVRRGIVLDPPGVRRRRLAEAIQVFKGLFADGPCSFQGEFYTIDGLDALPKPAQRPHPPFLIGGGGPRMLALAAQQADIVSINMRTTEAGELDWPSGTAAAADEQVRWVREAAGARFDALELNAIMFYVPTADREAAAAQLAAEWGIAEQGLSPADVLSCPHFLIGSNEQVIEELQQRRERYGISYVTIVGEEHLEAFAPIVARLAGT
jgi:probable F420-dependent oxidoreductase